MSDHLISRIAASDGIMLHTGTEITDLQGDHHLEQVTWHDRHTETTETYPIRHVFLMIGAVSNTPWLQHPMAARLPDAG
ncbi:hypothetical protein [Leptolyngbya sp. NIES-2104]|uniref:hypothetical protein n=1 Tax=Leptolyngbya sp. NIES-2104 TaxID=1552121 RepID=UPI0006EC8060|nr:hypothetical protein [Leptolyngbya sp. NIES-2104]GAP96683.1 thioredoxin reductase [Leptolyngbya sp. NIES-2104]